MSRIAIVSLTVQPGDAVGHDALQMQRVLKTDGHEAALFSSHWTQSTSHSRDVREVQSFLGSDPDAILLYHHAVGWDAGVELTCTAACRRVVRYHNVTPARFFAGLPGHAGLICARGREQLRELVAARCDLYLSASTYNQHELLDLGADPTRCAVVYPFHQVDRLLVAEPDPAVLAALSDGHSNLLFVGRRAPNKGHRFLIDAFAVYAEHYDPKARLLLIGREDVALVSYSNRLRDQASRLGVADRVVFIHGVSESELRAYYETATALVVASEHEGFCVPVVEAMALGVPVVAYGAAAVPDTVGEAGLLWPQPDPFLLAASVDRLRRQPALRAALAQRGRDRFRQNFDNERIAPRLRAALGGLLRAAA